MGTRKNRLAEAVLTSTHNLCFEQKCENIDFFLSESFSFLVVKFSIYFNRRVFVMTRLPRLIRTRFFFFFFFFFFESLENSSNSSRKKILSYILGCFLILS